MHYCIEHLFFLLSCFVFVFSYYLRSATFLKNVWKMLGKKLSRFFFYSFSWCFAIHSKWYILKQRHSAWHFLNLSTFVRKLGCRERTQLNRSLGPSSLKQVHGENSQNNPGLLCPQWEWIVNLVSPLVGAEAMADLKAKGRHTGSLDFQMSLPWVGVNENTRALFLSVPKRVWRWLSFTGCIKHPWMWGWGGPRKKNLACIKQIQDNRMKLRYGHKFDVFFLNLTNHLAPDFLCTCFLYIKLEE